MLFWVDGTGPPHLAEKVVQGAERILLKDEFTFLRLKEKAYELGELYGPGGWSAEVEADFNQWMEVNKNNLAVGREQIEEFLEERRNSGIR